MIVTERCHYCKYIADNGTYHYPFCDYLEKVGHRRGCPAGDECDKFEEKEVKKERCR